MRTKLATAALLGTLGLTGVAGAAVLAPAVSYAATGTTTAGPAGWVADALSGLVSDGSITRAQADEVASTLAEARPEGGPGGHRGPGGHGGRPDLAAAATALGLTETELQTRARAGQTLADVADAEGVDQAKVVDALVAAEEARLAEAVTAGRLTQAQADERAATLEERITERLDEPCGPGGRGPGGRGPGADLAPAPDADQAPDATEAPSSDTSTTTTDSAA